MVAISQAAGAPTARSYRPYLPPRTAGGLIMTPESTRGRDAPATAATNHRRGSASERGTRPTAAGSSTPQSLAPQTLDQLALPPELSATLPAPALSARSPKTNMSLTLPTIRPTTTSSVTRSMELNVNPPRSPRSGGGSPSGLSPRKSPAARTKRMILERAADFAAPSRSLFGAEPETVGGPGSVVGSLPIEPELEPELVAAGNKFNDAHHRMALSASTFLYALELDLDPTSQTMDRFFNWSLDSVRRNRLVHSRPPLGEQAALPLTQGGDPALDERRSSRPRKKRLRWRLSDSLWYHRKLSGPSRDYYETEDSMRTMCAPRPPPRQPRPPPPPAPHTHQSSHP